MKKNIKSGMALALAFGLLLALPACGGAKANEDTGAASTSSSVSSSADASASDAAVQSAVTLPELDEQKPVVTAEPESKDAAASAVSEPETTTANTATEKKNDAAPSKTTTSKTDTSTSKKTTSSTTTTTTGTGTGSTANTGNTGSTATGGTNKTNAGSTGTSAGSTASTPPSSSKTDNGNSNSSTNTSTAAPATETPSHTHDWVPFYTSVHHDEVGHMETVTLEEAYDEPVYAYRDVCSKCGAEFSVDGAAGEHMILEHDGGRYSNKKVQIDTIHHAAVTEQRYVVDQAAYDEQVLAGYRCSCGATKNP